MHVRIKSFNIIKRPHGRAAKLSIYPGRVLTSQTIGVEFASKIVKVGTGSRRKRIKLQV